MATVPGVTGESAPLSLYIDLLRGTHADLEVVGRAAIAWTKMIQEAAFLVDPFLEIRVELENGTEGSINLNSWIKTVRETINDPKKLKAIALGALGLLALKAGDWALGKGFDALWDLARREVPAFVGSLSEAEKAEMETIITRIVESRAARERAQTVFAELAKEERVTGVGVALEHSRRPRDVIPRSEFPVRSATDFVEETIQRRFQTEHVTLTLLAPALEEDDHKWKFRRGTKIVWAHMDDPDVRARIGPGSNSAPRMLVGILMDVDLETTQEFKDGVWEVVNQRVVKVHAWREPPLQTSLLDSPS